jgi:hypothetical protein
MSSRPPVAPPLELLPPEPRNDQPAILYSTIVFLFAVAVLWNLPVSFIPFTRPDQAEVLKMLGGTGDPCCYKPPQGLSAFNRVSLDPNLYLALHHWVARALSHRGGVYRSFHICIHALTPCPTRVE